MLNKLASYLIITFNKDMFSDIFEIQELTRVSNEA